MIKKLKNEMLGSLMDMSMLSDEDKNVAMSNCDNVRNAMECLIQCLAQMIVGINYYVLRRLPNTEDLVREGYQETLTEYGKAWMSMRKKGRKIDCHIGLTYVIARRTAICIRRNENGNKRNNVSMFGMGWSVEQAAMMYSMTKQEQNEIRDQMLGLLTDLMPNFDEEEKLLMRIMLDHPEEFCSRYCRNKKLQAKLPEGMEMSPARIGRTLSKLRTKLKNLFQEE